MQKCIKYSIILLFYEINLFILRKILNVFAAVKIKFGGGFSGKTIIKISNAVNNKSQKCEELRSKTEKLIYFYANN